MARQVSACIVTSIVFTSLIANLNTVTPTEQNLTTGTIIAIAIVLFCCLTFLNVGKDLDIFYINIIVNMLSGLVLVLIKKRCTKRSKSIQTDIFTSHEMFLVDLNNHTDNLFKVI